MRNGRSSHAASQTRQPRLLVFIEMDCIDLVPEIEVLPVARAGEGLERLKAGHVRGKIVVTLGPDDWT